MESANSNGFSSFIVSIALDSEPIEDRKACYIFHDMDSEFYRLRDKYPQYFESGTISPLNMLRLICEKGRSAHRKISAFERWGYTGVDRKFLDFLSTVNWEDYAQNQSGQKEADISRLRPKKSRPELKLGEKYPNLYHAWKDNTEYPGPITETLQTKQILGYGSVCIKDIEKAFGFRWDEVKHHLFRFGATLTSTGVHKGNLRKAIRNMESKKYRIPVDDIGIPMAREAENIMGLLSL